MSDRNKPIIGITMGDINGIGPEVILKTFADTRMFSHCTPVVYGSAKVLSFYKKALELEDVAINIITDIDKASGKTLNVINCWQEDTVIQPGVATEDAGRYALQMLQQAIAALQAGSIDALTTGPVNKAMIQVHQPDFAGQTEYLAQQLGEKSSLMMLTSDALTVALVTTHIPVKDVPNALHQDLIVEKIKALHESLRKDFLITRPRIAVFGLNPHAGEAGLLGKEDKQIVQPAIERARQEGLLAFGPYAADGFFGSGGHARFDAILAMYHDQGLTGFKALSFGSGINYTAGLSKVRTSPDHGTAYDLAGKGTANPESFRNALFLALDITANRAGHQEMYRNPLKRKVLASER